MNNLTIINHDGINVTDSREVSEMIGKDHSNLMRDIRGYIDVINKPNSNLKAANFFIESTYFDKQNQERPCYLLTRKGCDMVAHKMTGEKGILFTAEYVTRFDEMEKKLQTPILKLSKELQAIFSLDEKQQVIEHKVQEIEDKVTKFENDIPLFSVDCKELQSLVRKIGMNILGGYKSAAYKDNSLRGKVYSDIQHQLKREFGVTRYEAIKRSQLDIARKIVEEYKAPTVLVDEIQLANNQISFEREVG